MNSQDSNTLTAVNYFKNNYIKMIIFILVTLILTGALTHKHYKDNELYFSTVKIRTNGSIRWNIADFDHPHLDILYMFENNNFKNVRLIQSSHSNNVIEIEIPHKSLKENDNEDIKRIKKIMEEYKQLIIERVNINTNNLEKRLADRASETTNENVIKSYYSEIGHLLSRRDTFFELLENNSLYKFEYDGKINIKKAKRQMAKNLVISFMLSIILIIFSLWIKLFIREIKKNS